MRKILIGLFFVGIMISAYSEAQSQRFVRNYNQSISVNPIGLAFGILNATYEQQITEQNSFTAFGRYWSFGDWVGYGIGGSYRWYMQLDNELPITGFSFGPIGSLEFWDFDSPIYEGGVTLVVGGEAAYKLVFEGGFTLEPSLIVNFNIISINGLKYRPFALGVNFGYSW